MRTLLAELIGKARAAGQPVEVREDGDCGDLAREIDLALLEIVEDALANARMHAGGAPTTVSVHYHDDAIELRVANVRGSAWNGRGTPRGLRGMRERARRCGGQLEAGPDGRGGFVVHARLPREPVSA